MLYRLFGGSFFDLIVKDPSTVLVVTFVGITRFLLKYLVLSRRSYPLLLSLLDSCEIFIPSEFFEWFA